MPERKVVIVGAAGRDFHNFNVAYRNDATQRVVAFTATQIPDIDGRTYPPELAGPRYPQGIPIVDESALEQLIAEHGVDDVVFSYSDVSHEQVMHIASRALAAGADFRLLGPKVDRAEVDQAAGRDLRGADRLRQEPDHAQGGEDPARRRTEGRRDPPPDALRQSRRAARPALRRAGRPRPPPLHDRGAGGVRAAHRERYDHLRWRRLRGHPARGRKGRGRRALGRRQQRPAVLHARPAPGRRRPAAPRPRAELPPGRGQLPRRRRLRDQQGRQRRAGRGPGGDEELCRAQPEGHDHPGRLAGDGREIRPRSAGRRCW